MFYFQETSSEKIEKDKQMDKKIKVSKLMNKNKETSHERNEWGNEDAKNSINLQTKKKPKHLNPQQLKVIKQNEFRKKTN